MASALSLALEIAGQVEGFPLGKCGPSDDPDMQTAYLYGFRGVARRFVWAAKRVGDPDLSAMLSEIDTSPECITDAYALRADLIGVIDYLREVAENPEYERGVKLGAAFIDEDLVKELRLARSEQFDLDKLIRFCEELNDAYRRGNYISCALLMRAVVNHVPPLFGKSTFSQVVAGAGRSVKAVLSRLEDEARPIADLHNHMTIRSREVIPTKHQVEPYKPAFEILIQEILAVL
jgi:hypothetical protein